MTAAEFRKLADLHHLRDATRAACRLVLVNGKTGYAAAAATGVAESTVSRALARLARPVCQACGQVIKTGP